MDFPAAPITAIPIPYGFSEALQTTPDAAYGTGALGDVLAVFPDEVDIRSLSPDFNRAGPTGPPRRHPRYHRHRPGGRFRQ
ncbi:MAG: hypothetical protein ACRDQH_07400 [Pseudonocardiaceae bacterium]